MTTITREQAQAVLEGVSDLKAGYTLGHADVAILKDLARIALASLEAEPVSISDDMAYAFHHALSDSSLSADEVEEIKAGLRAAFANVTAPPAPVSIDERAAFNAWNNDTDCPLAGRDEKTAAWLAWSRRAAMLQGSQPVSNRDELPSREHFISLCDEFWNWSEMDIVCADDRGYELRMEWNGSVFTHPVTHALWRIYQAKLGNYPVIGWLRSDYNNDDKRDPNAPLFYAGQQ